MTRRASPFLLACGIFCTARFAVWAGPVPGEYDLFDGSGHKTGTIVVTLSTPSAGGKPVRTLESMTTISVSNILANYNFTERDTVTISSEGVTAFRQDTDDNGKKSVIEGERNKDALLVKAVKNGRNLAVVIPLNTYDMTEFETDLSSSPFRRVGVGESKMLRVFYLDTLEVARATREVSEMKNVPFDDREVSVLVAKTSANGKLTSTWFDEKTQELLQEEGPDYLMTRLTKP